MRTIVRQTTPAAALSALLCLISACAQAQPRAAVAARPEPSRTETARAEPAGRVPGSAQLAQRAPAGARADSAAVHARVGELLAALSTIEMHTRRVLGITGLRPAQLTFVDARKLVRSDTRLALEQAIGRSERKITQMRSDLQSSMILRDALVERDIPMSQVIAVDVTPDATKATIYYRPQE